MTTEVVVPVVASPSTLTTPNMFYLFSFPPVAHVYSASPFALKIESILRLYNIPHEVVYTLFGGSKRTMPYARINSKEDGKEIADSNEMIEYIRQHYSQVPKTIHPVEQFVLRMLEEHTTHLGFYYRYVIRYDVLNEVLDVNRRYFKSDTSIFGNILSKILPTMSANYSKKKIKFRGLAQHTDDEKWKFCNQDLQAISNYLGDNDWFLATEQPTVIDCVLFAHLAQFLYIPLDFPQANYLRTNCPNVCAYVDRFRDKIYPDWEQKCQPQDPDWKVKPDAPKRQGTFRLISLLPVITVSVGILSVAIASYNKRKRI